MNDEFGSDFLTVSDAEGNEFTLEHLDSMEIDGNVYMAFLPADMDEDDDDFGIIILKVVEDGGEEMLVSIDDEDDLNSVFDRFLENFLED